MKALNAIRMSGAEVLPLIEGGKGINVSNGESSGAWAQAGGIGTFSGVAADMSDQDGNSIPYTYEGKTRGERYEELIRNSIRGGIEQAKTAYETAGGKGRIHMNVLWEMGGCEKILQGILDNISGLIHGVTCGAGMPYRIAETCAKYGLYYYPIISSARAFSALWRRAYYRFTDWLGAVVYEDPWCAGGHNGLSNVEDPNMPEAPYARVKLLRDQMNKFGLNRTPIVMAGGVWYLRDWEDWIDNEELGPIAFQFGTRPLLTKESPISDDWKTQLGQLQEGDVYLNRFSPTGFYSSAVRNEFIQELVARSERQVPFSMERTDVLTHEYLFGIRKRKLYVSEQDLQRTKEWESQGFTKAMQTPDDTLIFVTPEQSGVIVKDQQDCMGCLSHCRFSNWKDQAPFRTNHKPDPRSFCIQKTLQSIGHSGDTLRNLMFAGKSAFNFATDPFYRNDFIPTVKQLLERIRTGN